MTTDPIELARQWKSRTNKGWSGKDTDAIVDALLDRDARLREAQEELEGLRSFKRCVDAALNSGDGSYRP